MAHEPSPLVVAEARARQLETEVERLNEQNRLLTEDKRLLHAENDRLALENRQLKDMLIVAEEHGRKDEVTGLYRRWYFMERVQEDITESTTGTKRQDTPPPESTAFLMIDLEDFSRFNNSEEGQPQGDRILKKAAAAMRRKLRHGEKIGRLGGDEFGLLLRNMTPEVIATKIAQISESLRQEDPTLAAYFGVEFYVPGMSVDDLYRAAAVRLSEAKRAKKAGQRVV
jgi:diguanylate cyclase (GGDEF)-like protein